MLTGRKALVTGAQQGIGRAIAIELARQGADVAINYLDDRAQAAAVAGEVEALGRKAVLIEGSVGVIAWLPSLVEQATAALGGLDILVNNAGVFPRAHTLELTEAVWDEVHNVNLKASCFLAQAFARGLVARKAPGAIVNIASVSAYGGPNSPHYSASKGGVVSLTRAMATDLVDHGIHVNAVGPGLVDTAQPRYGHSEDELVVMAAALPMKRIGRPDEIATVVSFLASDAASFMTGQTVYVNGGSLMP